MQTTFDWIYTIMNNEDEKRWLLITEGRHLTTEEPLFFIERYSFIDLTVKFLI